MARVSVAVSLDQPALDRYVADELAARQHRAAAQVRDWAKDEITSAGRVDTGDMRQQISAETEVSGGVIRSRVIARAEHSSYQHEGTPQRIYPARARVLRFKPKGSSAFVFAPSVRGIHPANPTPPLPFLTLALRRLDTSAFG